MSDNRQPRGYYYEYRSIKTRYSSCIINIEVNNVVPVPTGLIYTAIVYLRYVTMFVNPRGRNRGFQIKLFNKRRGEAADSRQAGGVATATRYRPELKMDGLVLLCDGACMHACVSGMATTGGYTSPAAGYVSYDCFFFLGRQQSHDPKRF